MSRFDNKQILVVGASSGIGLATAQRLARDGASVICVGRDAERLQRVMDTLDGGRHKFIVADVADDSCVDAIIKVGKECGGFHAAACCAGLHEVRPLSLCKADDLITSFNANVITAINCTRAVSKAASMDGASIVWLSSVAAIRGTAGFAAYACAKGALISASKVAAIELAKKKIRLNVIVAGVVETPMSKSWLALLSQEQRDNLAARHLLGLGKPEDIANVIAFLMSDEANWMTGATLVADGGLSVH